MKRSLTLLSRSLLTSLMLFLPNGLVQASIVTVPEKTNPIQREGKIIAQLPGFQSDFELPQFNPNSNGFQFSNADLTESLAKYNIDNFENDAYWREYFKGTLVWFFGPKACMNEENIKEIIEDPAKTYGEATEKCILTAPAKEWLKQNIQSMRYGLCEGIATASLYLWLWEKDEEKYAKRTNFFTDPVDEDDFRKLLLNNNKRINSLSADESELQDYITNLFILQSLTSVYNSTAAIRNGEKPSQILERLIGSMRLNPDDPYTMGIYQAEKDQKNSEASEQEDDKSNYKLTQGHSLVPFAVKDQGNGIYWVYVYDSNHPKKTPYVVFNTDKEEWSYQPDSSALAYKGDAQTKNLDLTRLSLRDLPSSNQKGEDNYFDCPFCDDDSTSSTGTQSVDISLVGQGDLSVTDLEGNEIPGVDTVPFKGGLNYDVPPSIHIPPTQSSQPFKITLRGTKLNNNANVVMVGSDFTVGFEGINLDDGEELTMYVYPGQDGPKVSFEANNDQTKIPTLFFSLNDDSTATGYNFKISDIQLAKGKLVQVVADTERKRLYLGDNDESDDNYTLKMGFTIIGKDGKDRSIPPYQGYSENEGVQVPVESTKKQVAYFAYGEWRANYFTRDYTTYQALPFYAAKFQPLGSGNGQAFNENTVQRTGTLFRNAGASTRN